MEIEKKLKKREIKKQKDEMTEEKKLKECLYCSSVLTLLSLLFWWCFMFVFVLVSTFTYASLLL